MSTATAAKTATTTFASALNTAMSDAMEQDPPSSSSVRTSAPSAGSSASPTG